MSSTPSLELRQAAPRPSTAERRPLVMVIDPDASARSVLEVALRRDGFDVWSAGTSEQGLERMAVERVPDVVVLETDLGGEDGYSFVSQLRGAPRTSGVKVLLLARPHERDVAELAEVVGADGFIEKPVFARDVAALVRLELARRDGHAMTFQSGHLPPAALLRAVLSTPCCGELVVADGRGLVRFARGHVTEVRFEGKRDLEALTRALALTRGSYSVRLCEVPAADGFVCGLRDLVQRVMPRLARWSKVVERSLPLDARLGVDFVRLSASLDAMPDEVNRIVRLFDGHRSVEDVVVDSPFDETLTLEVATRLYLMGVVAPVPRRRDEVLVLRQAPRLFEPRATEVEDLMQQLFAGQVEVGSDEAGAGLSDEDWFRAPEGTGLELGDPSGGWKATAPAELTKELAPELRAQLDAFDIPVHFEPPEPAPAAVSAFAHEPAAAPGATETLEQVLRAATGDEEATVVPRTAPVTPEPPPLAPMAEAASVDEGAFAEPEAFVSARKPRRAVWFVLVLALGALGAAVLFEALRGGPPREAEPVVAFPTPRPPPIPVEVPDLEEPVFHDDAPVVEDAVDVTENLAEARRLYESGRYAQAKSLLEQVLTDAPRSVTAWTLLGLVKYDSMDVAGAREAANQVLAIDPNDARVQVLLATLYFDAGDDRAARAALQRYLELEPEGPFADDAKALLRR
jgi:CheY-like chemotaxis protein